MGRISVFRPLAILALVATNFLATTATSALRHRSHSHHHRSKHSQHHHRSNDGGEILGYFADWATDQLPPEAIPYSKLTRIGYAFAIVNKDASFSGFNTTALHTVVKLAHSHNVKVSLALGGWDGGEYISQVLKDSTSRATLIKNILTASTTYSLDGIIMDWEYPNDPNGMICNTRDPTDSANLLTFFTELRSKVSKNFELSAATALTPFNGPNGNPLTDVKAFAKVMDRIQLMAYDVSGSWDSTTGPNAPLYTEKGAPEPSSGDSGVKAWTKAGFPANKIQLGVPFYGLIETVDVDMKNSQFVKFVLPQRKGDMYDSYSADPCPGAKKSYSGEYQFGRLLADNVLSSPLKAGKGWTRHFDNKTQTPWVYSSSQKAFITYDDPESMAAKVSYAKKNGLAGVMIWSLEMDPKEYLLDVLQGVRK